MKYLLRLLLPLLATLAGTAAQAQTIKLYTFHSPPYQVGPDPSASAPMTFGTTVDTVRCVAKGMDWQTEIHTVPQNRAIHGLRNHLIDGYFAVDESDLLNRYALPTAPVALEKWYFYSQHPIGDLTSARIAVIAGSNEAIWLEQSRYNTAMAVSYPDQLLALLQHGRVDAVLMDERVMREQRLDSAAEEPLHRQFVRFAPLSLYVTLPFATQHPSFLNEFNSRIVDCLSGGFALSQAERAALERKARALTQELITLYDVPGRLAAMGPPDALDEIRAIDKQWRALAPARASEKAAKILRSRLSGQLAHWQDKQRGLVTEVLVMDTAGASVAISVLTSDYWQGDERKFEAIAGDTRDTIYLGPIQFDSSAQRFQVMASVPLQDPATGAFVGAIALGLNIEKVLRRSDLPMEDQSVGLIRPVLPDHAAIAQHHDATE